MADKNFHGNTAGIGYIYVGTCIAVILWITFLG